MGIISRKSKTGHIDTNIMVRLITKDNPKQLQKAINLLSHEDNLYVFEDAAMMEVVFVLSGKVYQYGREKIAEKIKKIMLIPNLVCNKGLIEDSLNLYVKHSKLSFVDCYLTAVTAISQETPLWTLDKKLAAQSPIAKLL